MCRPKKISAVAQARIAQHMERQLRHLEKLEEVHVKKSVRQEAKIQIREVIRRKMRSGKALNWRRLNICRVRRRTQNQRIRDPVQIELHKVIIFLVLANQKVVARLIRSLHHMLLIPNQPIAMDSDRDGAESWVELPEDIEMCPITPGPPCEGSDVVPVPLVATNSSRHHFSPPSACSMNKAEFMVAYDDGNERVGEVLARRNIPIVTSLVANNSWGPFLPGRTAR